jgi:hypothetical protein
MSRRLLFLSLSAVALAGCPDDPDPAPEVPTVIVEADRAIYGLHQVGDHLYWTDWGHGIDGEPVRVRGQRIGDDTSTLLATVDDYFARVVAADPATGAVAWAQGFDETREVWMAQGAEVRQLAAGGSHAAFGVEHVYSDRITAGGIEVLRAPRAGGEPTVISTITGERLEPQGLFLVGDSLVIATMTDRDATVWRVPVAGGEPLQLANFPTRLTQETEADLWPALQVHGDSVLVPSRSDGIVRVPIAGGGPVPLEVGLGVESLAVVDDQVFWSGGSRIRRGDELVGVTGYNSDELAAFDGALLWCDSTRVLALDAALIP